MTDREKAGLRGPVAVCETHARSHVTREAFHRDGRRSEMMQTGEYPWSHRWLYDDHGRLLEEVAEGLYSFHRRFFYDARGRRKTVRVSDDNGERLEESYEYREDGSALHTSYPRVSDGIGVALGGMLHMSGDAVRITATEDSQGRAIERVLYDADYRRIQRVLFLYDSAGRLVEEGEAYFDNRIRDDFRNCFRYDEQGRYTRIEMYTPAGNTCQTMRYNEVGDLVERNNMTLPSDIDLFEQPPWTEYFSYTYDSRSNWIKRELVHRLDGTGETPHRDELHRQVEYWN